MVLKKTVFSVLDFVPITEGNTTQDAFLASMELAKHVEDLGFYRYWISEHHNMPGIASAATPLVMNFIASATSSIRVGAGGIMLPNHSPLTVAEQFGTLEAMYPNRIDLGLGRAPGTDRLTARALRRGTIDATDFPEDLSELRSFFEATTTPKAVRAIPGEGSDIPIWLLGSSDYSARLAAQIGLPFAFASHFAPTYLMPALKLYRDLFKPSDDLKQPRSMAAINVFAADTKEEAERIATSAKLQFLSLIRNNPGKLPKPVDSMDGFWSKQEEAVVSAQYEYTIIGTKDDVKREINDFINMTGVDEVMIITTAYTLEDRKKTYDIIAQALEIRKENNCYEQNGIKR